MEKKLGQHFLKNKAVVKKIIDAIAPKDDDIIIEIGPGHGELTKEFLHYPVRVIAIEKDPVLADSLGKNFQITSSKLQTNFKNKKLPKFEIIQGDVLEILPKLIRNSKLEIRNYKLVGNIPYYLTGFLFRTISGLPFLPARTVFMVQKEVALRAVATPPHMNLLAASIQMWAKPEIVTNVGKNDFSPKPKVDSAVIRLETHRKIKAPQKKCGDAGDRGYFNALHMLFKQPRKTILNNITLYFRSWDKCNNAKTSEVSLDHKRRGKIIELLKGIDVRPNDRPQSLHIQDIKKISEMLYNYHK